MRWKLHERKQIWLRFNVTLHLSQAESGKSKLEFNSSSKLNQFSQIYGWVPGGSESSIAVKCTGKGLSDATYFPEQGFPANNYPFLNQKGYRSALVAVKFNNVPSKLLTFQLKKSSNLL